jgi:hypothetical protein
MAQTVYILWGQYSDKSGEIFTGVYENKNDAEGAKELVERYSPSMSIKIEPVPFVRGPGESPGIMIDMRDRSQIDAR